MRDKTRTFVAFGLLASLAAASNAAITITPITATGATTKGAFGTSGYSYSLTNFAFGGALTPTASITFSVAADAGQQLTSFQLLPQGTLKNATYTVDYGTGTMVETGGAAAFNLGSVTKTVPITPTSLQTFTWRFALSGTSATTLVNAKNFNFTFAEQPVPEPASMAALAIGGLGLVARRKRNR